MHLQPLVANVCEQFLPAVQSASRRHSSLYAQSPERAFYAAPSPSHLPEALRMQVPGGDTHVYNLRTSDRIYTYQTYQSCTTPANRGMKQETFLSVLQEILEGPYAHL